VKLAAFRIKGMVEKLQLPEHLRESVYCLFQKILNQQTSLFFNRHIDQIILCCIYGVAKVCMEKDQNCYLLGKLELLLLSYVFLRGC